MFQHSSEICINLTKMENGDYYQLLINKEPIELKAKRRYVFFSWGGGEGERLGPQRGGSSVKVSTKRGGSYTFSRFF